MKRFYQEAKAVLKDGGWHIELDGRPVRTPQRAALVLPTETMARAIAEEWDRQDEMIDPAGMPFTGIANAAIDHVAADRAGFAAGIAAFGENDLLCYRASTPDKLVARQCKVWDPLLDWARKRFDVAFELTDGIMHVTQPEPTLGALRAALDAQDDFALAAAQPITTITGSLIITLALIEREIDVDMAWEAGQLDDLYAQDTWGIDDEAQQDLSRRRRQLGDAAAFLELR
ncbi:ATPase [Pacificimonas flava]|uniref:ATPase n=2 Tax=Pacificimonas TaxID=1960290 RepID=A0A219B6F6_9SPHN|nr:MULTISPECIES: ATP12 family protein [Pacificimonas]MBZ6378897.1 ATPase [Pacificimonas aurantium]OWV33851.1 ATPase [Pacificimonas flava]